jgi:hypothetical protein
MVTILSNVDRVILYNNELLITGTPHEDDSDHNCDEMGCATCEHVLLRIPLVNVTKGYNPKLQEKVPPHY